MMEPRNTRKDTKIIFKDESYLIQGAIFEVYKTMGSGFLEAVYQECLNKELSDKHILFQEQVELELKYKGVLLKQRYIPDFICFNKIIVEIKSVKNIDPIHRAQLLNYLKATGMKLGLLVNFGSQPKVQIERIVL